MDTKKITKMMKALSNPNRFEIFMEIYKSNQQANFEDEECFVYDVMQRLNIGAPTISHHLKELSNADLIITERRGKHIVARVNEETVSHLRDALILD
ncbi:MAG: winged helix-turn-helix transcriptional regulator [Candidatus Marinimicrobia bacterium]|nr:winged helix-turn-helix transcriptional regulator [Candidatus Neomarinimicrobiota bacterium]